MKLMHNNLKKSYPGVTSLLLVLAIGLVLTVMVAGITAFTIREIQQSSNTELSNRALQTAESGVRIAAQKLASNPLYQTLNDCPVTSTEYKNIVSDNLNESLTCVEVKSTFSGVFTGSAQTDVASQISMGPDVVTRGGTPKYVNVLWNEKTIDGNLASYAIPFGNAYYPTIDNAKKYAASIELDIVYWRKGNVNKDSFRVANIFLTPGRPDEGYTKATGRTQLKNLCEGQDDAVLSDNYACATVPESGKNGFNLPDVLELNQADRDDFNNNLYNVIIRLKPRYRGTHFMVKAYSSDGTTLVPIKSADAIIDVTAKTGNLYRRVKATAPAMSSVLENVFDSAIYSGRGVNDQATNGICKKIIVRVDNSKVSDTCQ